MCAAWIATTYKPSHQHTRCSMKVIFPSFFSQTTITVIKKFIYIYIYHGHICYQVKIIFPQSRLHYQHTCFIFACGAVCRRFKTLCWSIWACHFPQNIVRMYASRGQKHGSLWVLNWDCREDEGEQSTPLLQVPPSCTDRCMTWHFHAGQGLDSSSSGAEAFEFVVVTPFMSAQSTVVLNQCINHVFGFYSKTNQMHQCLKFILFWNYTLHFSVGFSVHHQDSRLYIQRQSYVKQILLLLTSKQ